MPLLSRPVLSPESSHITPLVNVAIFFPLTRRDSRRDYFIRIESHYRESISGKLAVPTSPPVATAKSTLRDEAHNGKSPLLRLRGEADGWKLVPAVDIVVFVVVIGTIFHFAFVRDPSRGCRLISSREPVQSTRHFLRFLYAQEKTDEIVTGKTKYCDLKNIRERCNEKRILYE